MLAFVDAEADVAIVEDLFTFDANFANAKVPADGDIDTFLARVSFPQHALIAVPNDRIEVGHDNRVRLVLDGEL